MKVAIRMIAYEDTMASVPPYNIFQVFCTISGVAYDNISFRGCYVYYDFPDLIFPLEGSQQLVITKSE